MIDETDTLTEQPTADTAVVSPLVDAVLPGVSPQGAGSWQLILVPIILCLAMMLYVSLI